MCSIQSKAQDQGHCRLLAVASGAAQSFQRGPDGPQGQAGGGRGAAWPPGELLQPLEAEGLTHPGL